LPKSPIAVFPGHFDRRIGAQRSAFTVHGTNIDGLVALGDTDKNAGLIKITIPSWAVRDIKRALDTCGIDETTVFPNLESLSRVIEARWKDEPQPLPHEDVYTRLQPSAIHGVGVFAITEIPENIKLFNGDRDGMVWIGRSKLTNVPPALKRLYTDFAVEKKDRYGSPGSFNSMAMSWYINDSKNPNVRCDSSYNFWTLTKIKPGDELTIDYSSYP
jgi:hypothetical protein